MPLYHIKDNATGNQVLIEGKRPESALAAYLDNRMEVTGPLDAIEALKLQAGGALFVDTAADMITAPLMDAPEDMPAVTITVTKGEFAEASPLNVTDDERADLPRLNPEEEF